MAHLLPTAPPGRITRKARGYAAEIARLRLQGYTLDSIRQALAGAGVQVSICTVWREAKRVDATAAAPPQPGRAPYGSPFDDLQTLASAAARPASKAPSQADAVSPVPAPCSAKDLAEAFVKTQITNPLFRSKE